MTETLNFINHCGKSWLVGINGKDITSAKTGGGKYDDISFMSIGNDEIDKCPDLKDRYPCKICGKLVEVKTSKPVENKHGQG